MASYAVRIFRPVIMANSPEEAAQKSMTDPLTAADQFYVMENDPTGSLHYIVGSTTILGGTTPIPPYSFTGPDFTPTTIQQPNI
jgi:hypothetical protein